MLKLKITTTVLALAGLVLLLMGGTYFTAAAAIDNAQKMGDVGQYVSIANVASILLAVVVPRSPKRDDDDGDSDKG